jgi:hypothetical protein
MRWRRERFARCRLGRGAGARYAGLGGPRLTGVQQNTLLARLDAHDAFSNDDPRPLLLALDAEAGTDHRDARLAGLHCEGRPAVARSHSAVHSSRFELHEPTPRVVSGNPHARVLGDIQNRISDGALHRSRRGLDPRPVCQEGLRAPRDRRRRNRSAGGSQLSACQRLLVRSWIAPQKEQRGGRDRDRRQHAGSHLPAPASDGFGRCRGQVLPPVQTRKQRRLDAIPANAGKGLDRDPTLGGAHGRGPSSCPR